MLTTRSAASPSQSYVTRPGLGSAPVSMEVRAAPPCGALPGLSLHHTCGLETGGVPSSVAAKQAARRRTNTVTRGHGARRRRARRQEREQPSRAARLGTKWVPDVWRQVSNGCWKKRPHLKSWKNECLKENSMAGDSSPGRWGGAEGAGMGGSESRRGHPRARPEVPQGRSRADAVGRLSPRRTRECSPGGKQAASRCPGSASAAGQRPALPTPAGRRPRSGGGGRCRVCHAPASAETTTGRQTSGDRAQGPGVQAAQVSHQLQSHRHADQLFQEETRVLIKGGISKTHQKEHKGKNRGWGRSEGSP